MENTDFIEIYDNSAPQELCDELIKWFDLCSDKGFTVHNMPFMSTSGKEEVKTSFRSDEAVSIPMVSSTSLPDKVIASFWDLLTTTLNHYVSKYDMGNIPLSCAVFKMHKVKEGQGYHVFHHETERRHNTHRVLAWMTYLKVPEEGGETEFLYQSKRIEPVVGRTLIWPAYFTHLHRGNPPLKGIKYYITGWFEDVKI